MAEYTISKIIRNGDEYSFKGGNGGVGTPVQFNYLVVGGGGGGGRGGGGAGGDVILGELFTLHKTFNISIGNGGQGSRYERYNLRSYGCPGGTTSMVSGYTKITAIGGCGGGCNKAGEIYNGGDSANYSGGVYCCVSGTSAKGGGAGAGGNGGNAPNCTTGGNGGRGICGYGGGGGGGGGSAGGTGVDGGGNGHPQRACNATNCGGGGGGVYGKCNDSSEYGGDGAKGVVDICYLLDGGSGFTSATGGDSCYTCDGYCVHRFTSNGTFTITG